MSGSAATPRRIGRPRPALLNQSLATSSNPDVGASYAARPPPPPSSPFAAAGLSAREVLARKASFDRLTSNSAAPDATYDSPLSPVEDEDTIAPPAMAPVTPAGARAAGSDGAAIDVGDAVDVPGGMHGTVKFIGSVKGKSGVFAGVELSREFAARGKNDGDVDGIHYFQTSLPHAGIFLPLARATKRASPSVSLDSFPPTPTTPSAAPFHRGSQGDGPPSASGNAYTPPTPSVPKFSQSVGPGRAPSPQFKPRGRPSLPRPESPIRRAPGLTSTPGTRPSLGGQGSTTNGIGQARHAPSPTPGKFGASLGARRAVSSATPGGDPGKRPGFTPKGGTKTTGGSGLSKQSHFDDVEGDANPIGVAQTGDDSRRSSIGFTPRPRPVSMQAEEEVKRLRGQIEERDRQLKGQAASLAEMENSLAELQSLMPSNGSDGGGRGGRGSLDESDTTHLRSLLREKNEKIAMLTAEFDAHRADFRSTIDTLEMASTETERVYERKVEELKEEVRDLNERSEDVESVAQQLKQLEELVQELEEGLEDARRGEAEARGEVEFLRGEVERGRSELRREREKAATAMRGAGAPVEVAPPPGGTKEVEQRDDEIRGLKAIIHSLSRDAVSEVGSSSVDSPTNRRATGQARTNGSIGRTSLQLSEERLARETLQREVKELQGLVERKSFREDQLEQELHRMRKDSGSSGQRGSFRTIGSQGPGHAAIPSSHYSSKHNSGATNMSWRDGPRSSDPPRRVVQETITERHAPPDKDAQVLWCEICETSGHDILTCTNMFGKQQAQHHDGPVDPRRNGKDVVMEGLRNISTHGQPPQHSEHVVSPLKPTSPLPPPPANPMPNPTETGMVAGKASGVIDPDKWCALCERDGHESVDCPFEDAF
ncbi:MAG: hypothetical protein M1838_000728 [Thelocarpon superellum]|nr:MAG: hypothetical protein M1838_000728 [Thelocarpon superellum]